MRVPGFIVTIIEQHSKLKPQVYLWAQGRGDQGWGGPGNGAVGPNYTVDFTRRYRW